MAQDRLPPGQRWTDKVIEYANLGIPEIDMESWRLKVHGLVTNSPTGRGLEGRAIRLRRAMTAVAAPTPP